jgi:signal transduction histidine kinase/DNA-binding response OmpR family regulator
MPEKNRFAYQLEGYDKNWNFTTADQRIASFSNLSPGNYTFHLKASNNDGLWNDEMKSINLEILAPPWKSWWAYIIYLFVLSLMMFIGLRVYYVRKKFREQLQLERLSKEKISELNRIKIQFFTNISHEFKTPLTLISGPLKKILTTISNDSDIESDIKLVQRNVTRLHNLINQLMDFRTIENKKMKVNSRNGDVVQFVKELLSLFSPLMEEHRIQFTFECGHENFLTQFDHDIFEKIFFNLISNAVKFTPAGGNINVSLNVQKTNNRKENLLHDIKESETLNFQISNSGAKIPESQIQYIFDNYFHIEKHNNSALQKGSGVGLAFTKELVELLNGDITVSSTEQHTCFQVRIPLVSNSEEKSQGVDNHVTTHNFDYSQELVNLLETEKKQNRFKIKNTKLTPILIVEDNQDLQVHLFDLFHLEYNVYVGSDGIEGLHLASQKKPVLIISDVMMPKMNGTEMCRRLKSDILTSHIPIIMLSAFNSQEQKYEGMESGADVYVEKPFDPDYLKLQVKNLIQSREAIRLAFSKKITAEPGTVQISSTDELFIQKAIQIIEKNMDNNEFNVESFVAEIGIGRTVLYQKIKALTDLSVNEFIQNIRLKRAAQLLKDSDLSISEIAYSVGFNDPKYFSTCFKKNFSLSPTEFVSREKTI